MKKILFLLGLFVALTINTVYAEDNLPLRKHRFPNAYGVFDGVDRVHLFYAQSYSFNGEIAYCIEPGVDITTELYSSTDDLSITGLSQEVLDKVRLIAYYGFAYNTGPHLNNNYYMASQEMIWKEITGRDTYWVSEEDVNGPRINIDREKNEIKTLMEKHDILPSFDKEEVTLKVGESYTLEDTNDALSRFQLVNNEDNVKINGNLVTIIANSLDDSKEIKLVSKTYTDNVPLIYYNGNSQKLMTVFGKLDPQEVSFRVKVIPNVKIKVVKIDAVNKEQIEQAGIKFKIKNVDTNEYLCDNDECIYETNSDGEFITGTAVSYGNYQIEEIPDNIPGYFVNNEPLPFKIDDDTKLITEDNNIYAEVAFENQPVLGKVIINKLGEKLMIMDDYITYSYDKLDGVNYKLYAANDIYTGNNILKYHKDELVSTVSTTNGSAVIDNLVLGKYYLIEDETLDNYVIDPTIYDVILEQDGNNPVMVTFSFRNYLKKGVFTITKMDKTTGLPLEGATISLYSETNELIYRGVTNQKGTIIIEGLPLGKYYYLEDEAPSGYIIDTEKHYFELSENNQVFNANLVNELVQVPNTNLDRNNLINVISLVLFVAGGLLFGKNY